MCEFEVTLNGKKIFDDAVYLKRNEEGNLLVSDVIGRSKDVGNVRIMEVDVSAERLVLSRPQT